MTQLPLGLTLADRVRVWAERHERATFDALCEAMRAAPTEVDIAARGVGALHWDGGFFVGRPRGGEEQGR